MIAPFLIVAYFYIFNSVPCCPSSMYEDAMDSLPRIECNAIDAGISNIQGNLKSSPTTVTS